jgi:hypothetical protein
MDLSWTVDRAGDASLVRCRVRNDGAVSRRVRIDSRFDAPVLPPRRAGVPEGEWDAGGVTLRIDPGERRGVGFAAPATPVDPPVEIGSVEPVDPDECARGEQGPGDDRGIAESAATDALRGLGDHRPPRAAVDGGLEAGEAPVRDGNRGGGARRDDECPGDEDASPSEGRRDASGDTGERERGRADAVEEWFAAVDARVGRAERLTDADVEAATAVVADAGGVDPLIDLDDRVAEDAERLRAVSERAAALAERAAATDVPVGALERLA